MTIIKDKDNYRAYKLIGDVLLQTPLYSDNTINEKSWSRVEKNYSSHQLDIIKKLKSINQIVLSINKGISDDL